MFDCCKSSKKKEVYELRYEEGNGKTKVEYVESLPDKDTEKVNHLIKGIVKMKSGDYHELSKQYSVTSKFTDEMFPPNQTSLGDIPEIPHAEWKRISDILLQPKLIVNGIKPTDVIQKRLNKCYFLSSIATLAEKSEQIEEIFMGEKINDKGMYKIKLKVDGEIREIIVDDFVPVDQDGDPYFCQPNQSEVWVMILEKAWAKLKGSYANISTGNPTEVFKAITYAPSELLEVPSDYLQANKIWDDIKESLKHDKPICAGTRSEQALNKESGNDGLVFDHFYTVISAVDIKDNENHPHQIMKLRNPWGKVEWVGKHSQNDSAFWLKIPSSDAKERLLGSNEVKVQDDGIFLMSFQDFCTNFETIHICHVVPTPHYENIRLFFDGKHGQIFMLTVKTEDQYIIELHQSLDKYDSGAPIKRQNKNQFLNRSTIIAMKPSNYEFIDGAFSYENNDTSLRLDLLPGKYLIYVKIDPDQGGYLPYKTSVSCYSKNLVQLKKLDKQKLGNIYQKMFLEYAHSNKKKLFNKEKMWMSWKQFYSKGGLAFVAFGVDIVSDKKFIITFNEKDFNDLHYVLKKPYKGKGVVKLEVNPGEEKIIVARVKKGPPQEMSFPPDIDIKMEKA